MASSGFCVGVREKSVSSTCPQKSWGEVGKVASSAAIT